MMQPLNKMDKKLAKEFGKERFKVEFIIEEQNEDMAREYLEWLLRGRYVKDSQIAKEESDLWKKGVLNGKYKIKQVV
jgi:type II secretory pathway predicted ATPase ExeA